MKIPCSGELLEVGYVGCHQDPVFPVGSVEYLGVRGPDESPVANMDDIKPRLAQLHGHGWGQVLIEQQLDVIHGDDRREGRPA